MILSTVLNMCALPQQVGKSEGGWLAKSGRPQGMGCLEAPRTHSGARCTLHANEAKRFLCASRQNCAKVTMSPAHCDMHAVRNTKAYKGGVARTDKRILGFPTMTSVGC